jgi:5'-3' exonuclease
VKKTLLVDGNNLMKIGFHGVKDYFHNGEHIGALYHFMNTLRKFIDEQNFDKVVVFWDGEDSTSLRGILYPKYKQNRKLTMEDAIFMSYLKQKNRIKQYLEEVYIRQLEISGREADDLIAYYCHVSENEDKLIFSSDRDLTQLISEKVSIYSPSLKSTFKYGDKIKFDDFEFPHYNVKTLKIMTGDKSDNIEGIYLLGEKTLVKFFPEILETEVSYTDILKKAEDLLKENKDNQTLKNLLTGKTKSGIFEQEFFQVNEQIVDLSNPLLTDEDKKEITEIVNETLEQDGRSYRNVIKYMVEDGLFKYLPKGDDAWTYFLKPFMKLTRKEKNKPKNR